MCCARARARASRAEATAEEAETLRLSARRLGERSAFSRERHLFHQAAHLEKVRQQAPLVPHDRLGARLCLRGVVGPAQCSVHRGSLRDRGWRRGLRGCISRGPRGVSWATRRSAAHRSRLAKPKSRKSGNCASARSTCPAEDSESDHFKSSGRVLRLGRFELLWCVAPHVAAFVPMSRRSCAARVTPRPSLPHSIAPCT